MTNQLTQRGSVTTLTLVFAGIFLLTFSSISGYIMLQLKQSRQKAAWHQALAIAEAGVNYYRWHLAHSPNDLQDGQASCCADPPCSACGPYIHDYSDPEGGVIGQYSLEISGNEQCGQISAVTITSTGWNNDYPNSKRTIQVRYVQPTIADFAYLINDNVWAGSDREIKGPYHSNGGIRMDGENKSIVTSGREDWICTSSFGCNPCPDECTYASYTCTCPGVFTTANGNEELFDYPVPPFDFDGITMDLAQVKALTLAGQGLYIPPSGNNGYHLVFVHGADTRSVDVYEITNLDSVYAYDTESGWHWEDSVIDSQSYVATYQIPNDCGLVFVEDDVWVEGEIMGKITTVSADLINPNNKTDVWLEGNIEYTTRYGDDGFVMVAQNNNLIGLEVPDNMELHGVYIAQDGRFGRNHYSCSWYWPECKRAYLEIFGTVASNGRVGTKWTSGVTWVSGFETRENVYDPLQSYLPPSFLPVTSEQHMFKQWEELE